MISKNKIRVQRSFKFQIFSNMDNSSSSSSVLTNVLLAILMFPVFTFLHRYGTPILFSANIIHWFQVESQKQDKITFKTFNVSTRRNKLMEPKKLRRIQVKTLTQPQICNIEHPPKQAHGHEKLNMFDRLQREGRSNIIEPKTKQPKTWVQQLLSSISPFTVKTQSRLLINDYGRILFLNEDVSPTFIGFQDLFTRYGLQGRVFYERMDAFNKIQPRFITKANKTFQGMGTNLVKTDRYWVMYSSEVYVDPYFAPIGKFVKLVSSKDGKWTEYQHVETDHVAFKADLLFNGASGNAICEEGEWRVDTCVKNTQVYIVDGKRVSVEYN